MEWLLEEANKIKNSNELKAYIVDLCHAHACHVALSHQLSQPGLVFDVCSKVEAQVADRFFSSLSKKFGYLSSFQQTFMPSNLWKEIYRLYPHQAYRIHALLIGVEPDLFQKLTSVKKLNYAIIKWQKHKNLDIDFISHMRNFRFSFEKYKQLISSEPLEFKWEIPGEDIAFPLTEDDDFRNLLSPISACHLKGENAGSLISIPVALRPTPDGEPANFLSVGVYWFGMPIQATSTEIAKAIVLANYVTPRLFFPMDIETPYTWALRLGRQLKKTGSRVHDHSYWGEAYHHFLQEHASALFLNYPIPENISSLQFHHGLSFFESLDTEHTCKRFDSGALLAVTALHFICHRNDISQILTIEQDSDEAFEIPEIIIDYQSWTDFLKYLRQGTAKYGDSIQKIHWHDGTLKLYVAQSETIKNLKHKVLMLYHDRENAIQRHETAKAFLNTFLPENNSHENHFMIKSHDMMITVGGAPAEHCPLVIEFNETDKSIELQIQNNFI